MLKDKVRMRLYQKAIAETIKKGDIVVDIGTGSGILALLAVRAGAKRVYAIEQTAIIEEAKKIARHNTGGGKIVFIKNRSDKVKLSEKVDVVVSELMGSFGIEENLYHFQVDARDRFLKSGGKLIPSWLELYLVPVESGRMYNELTSIWSSNFYGCDFSFLKAEATSQHYVKDCSCNVRFLAPPVKLAYLDFWGSTEITKKLECKITATKNGTLHGLVGFFKAGLSSHTVVSNSPRKPATHWKQVFFPTQNYVRIKKGDKLDCRIVAIPFGNSFFWGWDTVVSRASRKIAVFNQTDLDIRKEGLAMCRYDYKPILEHNGKVAQKILSLCNGKRTIEEVAGLIKKAYPRQYKTIKEAAQNVSAIISDKIKI
jgi:hypothetical protein